MMLYRANNLQWEGNRLRMAGDAEPKGTVIEIIPGAAPKPGERRLYCVRYPDGPLSEPMHRVRARQTAEAALLHLARLSGQTIW
ncbi:hypothetical protein Q2941_32525 [Bradyrhizobium sp. UFLA05-153]